MNSHNEIDSEIKEIMAITIINWHTKYRISYPPENHQAERRDLDYPLAVLLPVIMGLIFPPVEDSINLASPHESDATELVPYPAWGGEYDDILQSNTCSIYNILGIISSNKTTITKSLELIGTTPSETKFYRIFELVADCKFEKLRDFIAKEIGLEIIIESFGWIKCYDFFGSKGYFVNYLISKDLCNDKYFTNFKCLQCTNNFNTCLRSVL